MPQDAQKGQVYTEGPEGQNSATAEAVGSTADRVTESYTATVQTRPYRFEVDGWDFTKSQTTTTRFR
jgi:hypothetical protein